MSQWIKICALTDIPVLGARVVKLGAETIAVFRNASDEVFALHDRCPHKGGPLSQGIVHGRSVTCPMHGWKIGLDSGCAEAPDEGRTPCPAVKVEAGEVYLQAAAVACAV